MVRPLPIHLVHHNFRSLPLAMAMFVSVSVLVSLCARHSKQNYLRKYSKKSTANTDSNIAPPSPLMLLPNKIIASTSDSKADDYKVNPPGEESEDHHHEMVLSNPNEGFGEGGLWQKSILMGEKCQPPEFSGVLFYDSYGNRISELPRSPRALYVQRDASSPVARDGQ